MNPRIAIVAFLALALLAGCQTTESRIRQNPTVFGALDKATQERIRRGEIQDGDTEDLVYLALGSPKARWLSEDGTHIIWLYRTNTVTDGETRLVRQPTSELSPPAPYMRDARAAERYDHVEAVGRITHIRSVAFRDHRVDADRSQIETRKALLYGQENRQRAAATIRNSGAEDVRE